MYRRLIVCSLLFSSLSSASPIKRAGVESRLMGCMDGIYEKLSQDGAFWLELKEMGFVDKKKIFPDFEDIKNMPSENFDLSKVDLFSLSVCAFQNNDAYQLYGIPRLEKLFLAELDYSFENNFETKGIYFLLSQILLRRDANFGVGVFSIWEKLIKKKLSSLIRDTDQFTSADKAFLGICFAQEFSSIEWKAFAISGTHVADKSRLTVVGLKPLFGTVLTLFHEITHLHPESQALRAKPLLRLTSEERRKILLDEEIRSVGLTSKLEKLLSVL